MSVRNVGVACLLRRPLMARQRSTGVRRVKEGPGIDRCRSTDKPSTSPVAPPAGNSEPNTPIARERGYADLQEARHSLPYRCGQKPPESAGQRFKSPVTSIPVPCNVDREVNPLNDHLPPVDSTDVPGKPLHTVPEFRGGSMPVNRTGSSTRVRIGRRAPARGVRPLRPQEGASVRPLRPCGRTPAPKGFRSAAPGGTGPACCCR